MQGAGIDTENDLRHRPGQPVQAGRPGRPVYLFLGSSFRERGGKRKVERPTMAPKRGRTRRIAQSDEVVSPPSPTKVSRWLIALILVLSGVVIFSSLHVLSKLSESEGSAEGSRGLRGDSPVAQSVPPPPSQEPKKKKYFCTPDHCGDKTLYPDS